MCIKVNYITWGYNRLPSQKPLPILSNKTTIVRHEKPVFESLVREVQGFFQRT